MSAPAQTTPTLRRGVVKHVLSGDALIIRGQPKGGPPPEKQLCLSNITAPRVARRATPNMPETKDEPWAWEAREFMRKKCIGKEIVFTVEYTAPSGREYGCIHLGSDTTGENLTESLISQGLVEVRRGGIKASDESQQRLIQLEDNAKSGGLGKWGPESAAQHIRDIKWTVEEPRKLVDSKHGKPVKAVIEHVRDGCTVRAFLLPDFQYVTLMLAGIKAPMSKMDGTIEPFSSEAKYFVESRLLQRDVEIILEGVSNQNVLGTVMHPNGNITEMLLTDGFARCVDWSIGVVSQGVEKYRAAEKLAKEKRLRIWKDWSPSAAAASMGSVTEKEYSGKVVEVTGADGLVVKAGKETRKIFLSSIRPPRPVQNTNGETPADPRKNIRERSRPLYDVPYMFEAREFLRKKLIGKRVNVKVDYVQPPANNFPEKVCCTVSISNSNVAETLITKGLATVVRYRQDDDQRSSCYDDLLSAEARAQKKLVGLHSNKDAPIHRIQDMTSGESAKAKQFLPFLTRQNRVEALVEFVASGSRVRVYIPKETCLLTLLLNGIQCPRGARPAPGPGGVMLPAEPHGDEATAHTRELVMQREVEIKVDTMDKAGNFIGWLFADGVNMSVSLVESGYAKLFYTAEGSPYQRELETAEAAAKQSKIGLWKSFVEEIKDAVQEVEDSQTERHKKLENIIVTEVSQTDLTFFAQKVEHGKQLEAFMAEMRAELHTNPPLPGSYTPKRGDVCAAKFIDDLWYRAKVEKVDKDKNATVLYMDFGNRDTVSSLKTAPLPSAFVGMQPQAKEYRLAFVQLPTDEDYIEDAMNELYHNISNRTLYMNVEMRGGATGDSVSLYLNEDGTGDVALKLLEEGFLLAEHRRERRLQKMMSEYKAAQNSAKNNRLNLWQYGDITQDDAKEFGIAVPR